MSAKPLSTQQTTKSARMPLLDGMRGIAAMGVMFYHAQNVFMLRGSFAHGYLFVDFFFLLSGFVLTLAAEPKLQAGWGTGQFMWARVLRLWPVIVVGVAAGALSFALQGKTANLAMLIPLALLMLPYLGERGLIFPLNSPQWSLLMELLANLAHGLLLRRLGDRALLAVAALSGIALIAANLVYGSAEFGPDTHDWWLAVTRVGYSYTLGVWMGRRWQAGEFRQLIGWRLALVLPMVVQFLVEPLSQAIVLSDSLAITLLLPATLWLGIVARPDPSAYKFLAWLGGLSYPLYAVHLPLLQAFAAVGKTGAHLAGAIVTALLAAWLIDATIEKGLRRRKRQSKPVPYPA